MLQSGDEMKTKQWFVAGLSETPHRLSMWGVVVWQLMVAQQAKLFPPCLHKGLNMLIKDSVVHKIKLGVHVNSEIICQHLHKDSVFHTKLPSIPKTVGIKPLQACRYCSTTQIFEISSILLCCEVLGIWTWPHSPWLLDGCLRSPTVLWQ